ncbi:MAG TPA: hypothetical protein VF723_02955 [Pyrinomonadaceae bacterium]|jgi:hypothetical protein
MPYTITEQNREQRFLVNLPVHAEWDEERTGQHIIAEGTTENVGPAGAVVVFQQLPAVGSHIRISVENPRGSRIETIAEVIRLVRDLQQPTASLSVVTGQKQWRGEVWEPAGIEAAKVAEQSDDAKK